MSSNNWAKLQARLGGGGKRKVDSHEQQGGGSSKRAKIADGKPPTASAAASSSRAAPAPALTNAAVNVPEALSPRLALDCEMVGVGEGGKRSALARVVIVGFDERVTYAAFVRPPEPVTDYRTAVSGVRPEHMAHALPLRRVQDDVAALLRERIVIGHALHNDLKALMLEHPRKHVRDTASFPPFRKQQGAGTAPRRLQWLAKEFLGWDIQGAEHSPAEDAVAALRLYKLKMSEWERAIAGGSLHAHTQTSGWERALKKGKDRHKERRDKKKANGGK